MKHLMENIKKVIIFILVSQSLIIIAALVFASPVGIWLIAELSLTIVSPFLQFLLGLAFLWAIGSIASSILGLIIAPIIWILFLRSW